MDAMMRARLRAMPAFAALERRRRMLCWGLAILIMALYGAFLLLVAYDKGLAATPIGAGPVTLAFPLGLGMIVVSIALTGVYALRADVLDRLADEVRQAAMDAQR